MQFVLPINSASTGTSEHSQAPGEQAPGLLVRVN